MGRKINLGPFFILSLFIFVTLLFYYPIFLGKLPFNGNLLTAFWFPWNYNLPFKFMGVDEIREFFPLLDFNYQSLRSGSLPFWNPYNFSGTPHLANWASAVFYPLQLPIFFFGKLGTLIFLKLTAIVFSGFFTFLFLRALSLNRRAALFGGVAFAFSAPMLVWGAEIWQAVHTIIWLPLVFFAIENIIKKRTPFYIFLGAFGLAASVMAGYIQPTIYVYLFAASYALLRSWPKVRLFFPLLAMFFLSFAFSAVQVFPAIEAFMLSPRREIALTEVNLNFLLPPNSLLTFFAPDIFGHPATQNWFAQRPGQYYESLIYVGVVPLVVSFFSFWAKKFRDYVWFFLIWTVLALSLVFNLPTSRLVYYFNLPFLSTAIPIRIIFLVAFSISVLSAFGLSWWFEADKGKKRQLIISLLPLTIVYTLIGFWLFGLYLGKINISGFPQNWFIISISNFVTPLAVFILTTLILFAGSFKTNFKRTLYIFLILIFTSHSFIFVQKYFSFTDRQFLYPDHPMFQYLKNNLGFYRFWGYGQATLENNFATVYKIYSPEGYDPVNIKRYNELLSSVNSGKLTGIASRSDALIPRPDFSPLADTDPFRLKLLDLLGVKFVVYSRQDTKKEERLENERFKPVWQKDNFVIFENKKALERAFLVPEAIYAGSGEEAIKMVLDPQFDLAKKVILGERVKTPPRWPVSQRGEPNGLLRGGSEPEGKAEITQYLPNKVVIRASTNVPQFLVLTDNFYPAWQATIDHQPAEIYPANYTFRAVFVPKGEHEVVFEYKSKTFIFGVLISMVGLLIAAGALIVSKIKMK